MERRTKRKKACIGFQSFFFFSHSLFLFSFLCFCLFVCLFVFLDYSFSYLLLHSVAEATALNHQMQIVYILPLSVFCSLNYFFFLIGFLFRVLFKVLNAYKARVFVFVYGLSSSPITLSNAPSRDAAERDARTVPLSSLACLKEKQSHCICLSSVAMAHPKCSPCDLHTDASLSLRSSEQAHDASSTRTILAQKKKKVKIQDK